MRSRVLHSVFSPRKLFSDDQLQLGNEVRDELTVRADRLAQRVSPPFKLDIALAQKRMDKALEGLAESGVRDVAFVLVEFTGREPATWVDRHLVQLVRHRRLAVNSIT
jgi:hypothetical protein